jgi:hypothetical protein
VKIKKYVTGTGWVQDYPEVNVDSIVATGTPSSTTFLRGDGTWSTPADTTTLTSLGITATATELNYVGGVTSAIQTQLNGKAATSHTHTKSQITDFAHTHAISEVTNLQTSLDTKAPLASPALSGVPTAPTANSGTNTTQIATTAFVQNALTGVSGGMNFAGSINLSTAKNGDNLAAAGLTGPGDYLIVTATGDITNAGAVLVTLAVQEPGDEGDFTLPVTLETGDWIVYVSGTGGTMTVAIINNTDTRFAPTTHTHTIANVTGLQTALDGKVAKAGDTMTGALQMPATVAHPGNSAPTALAYGKLTGYGSFHINADTDGTTTEFLYLTAGYGQGAGVSNEGLRIGHAESSLTWKGHRVFTDNYHPNADTWTTARTLTIGNTGKSVNGSGNVSWSLAEIGAYAATNPSGFITSSGSITGSAGSAPLLSKLPDYTWSASTNPRDYADGLQVSFVQAANGFPSFGTVITAHTYSDDGGTLQLYTPYSNSFGGAGLRYRRGLYNNAGWTPFYKIWSEDNDGSGSGLDADLLDGQHASAFAASSHTHNELHERSTITYGGSFLQWSDQSGNGGAGTNGAAPSNPYSEWFHHLVMNHGNSSGYYVDIAAGFHQDYIGFRRNVGGNLQPFRQIYHDTYHPEADNANTVDGYHIVYGSTGSDTSTLYFVP